MNKIKLTSTFGILSLIWSCEYNQLEAPINCETEGPQLSLNNTTMATCGASDGAVELNAAGGVAPYIFSSENLESQETGSFSGLSAGVYSFTIEDVNGCQNELQIAIENNEGVSISSETTQAGCSESNGTIEVAASGGTLPYSYKIDNGQFQSGNVFSDLSTGTYLVQVIDDAGCEFNEEVRVPSGISLNSTIVPIIQSNCAVSGCHDGSQSPNLSTKANIIDRAERIMARTGAKTMPPNGETISQANIDEIACWVNDGALDN